MPTGTCRSSTAETAAVSCHRRSAAATSAAVPPGATVGTGGRSPAAIRRAMAPSAGIGSPSVRAAVTSR